MRTSLATKRKKKSQPKGPSQLSAPVPRRKPRLYLPDLTTRARRAAIDSVDFAALDFFVGAIAIVGFVGWCSEVERVSWTTQVDGYKIKVSAFTLQLFRVPSRHVEL
jgi:hypothetical protein